MNDAEILDWFFVGTAAGMIVLLSIGSIVDRDPFEFGYAMQPAVEAAGITGDTVSALRLSLNPCITKDPLPDGCKKYVREGVVTQPRIRIIVDQTK